ncbi:MAG: hypothetical protein WC098_04030 [Bacteroidales bacterium]
MDIERLKELRKKIPEYYGNGFMSLVHCDNMLDLIDDAIARQSVKSEEVAEAIGDLLDMKEHWCADSTYNDAISIDLAITALQAYQPTISKTETTGCHYCRGIESHGIVAVKTVIDEYLRVIPAYDTPYNYCPNCGRRLRG